MFPEVTIILAAIFISTSSQNIELSFNGVNIPDNDLIADTDITSTNGVHCTNTSGKLVDISWSLPNGVVLSNAVTMSSNIQFDMPSSDTARIRTISGSPSSLGIYQCRAQFEDGSIIYHRVWISNTSEITIDRANSKCSYIGPDIAKKSHGILTTLTISNGAPTTIECKLDGDIINQDPVAVTTNSLEDPTSVEVNFMSLIPFTTTGSNDIICTASNRAGGSGTFTCNLQTRDTQPTIQSIARDALDSTRVSVNWTLVSTAESYLVIAQSIDGSDFIELKDIIVSGTSATLNGVHPPLNYYLSVLAEYNQTSSSSITLPSPSDVDTITPFQCQPGRIEKVTLRVNQIASCDTLDTVDQMNLIRIALNESINVHENCTMFEPECKEKTGGTKKTKKTKKTGNTDTSGKVEFKVEIECGPCQGGTLSSDRTPKGTPRTNTKKSTPKSSTKEGTPKQKRTSKKRQRQSRQALDLSINYNGQEYTGRLYTKTYPSKCSSLAKTPTKGTKRRMKRKHKTGGQSTSCDCPVQCFAPVVKPYNCGFLQ